MAFKTYAMLGTSAGIADADLVAIFHGTGPLTSVTAAQVKAYAQTGAALLAGSAPFTATQQITASAAAPASAADYLQLRPSDYGAGKPGLFLTKSPAAGAWTLSVTDGAAPGELDLNLSVLKVPAATAAGASLNLAAGTAPASPGAGDVWATSAGLFARGGGVTGHAQANLVLHALNQTSAGLPNSEGGWTPDAWNRRVLNTVGANTIAGASLASNQITLPAGAYEVLVRSVTIQADATRGSTYFKTRVLNVTDASTLLTQNATGLNPGAGVDLGLSGYFTLSAAKAIAVEVYPNGFAPSNYGVTVGTEVETWLSVLIRKVG